MKIGFFEEAEGVRSMTRLLSFILMIFFIIVNIMHHVSGSPIDYNYISYNFMLLLAIFTPKLIQKYAEQVKTNK